MEEMEDLSQNFVVEKAMIAFCQAGIIPEVLYSDPSARPKLTEKKYVQKKSDIQDIDESLSYK